MESRLNSVERGFSDLAREIKESETRNHLRILQIENRLLNGILANRGEVLTRTRSLSQQPPENFTNVTSSRYGDGPSQTFPYTPSTNPKDSKNHGIYDYIQDIDLNHLGKRQCLCHHVPTTSNLENSIALAPRSSSTMSNSTMDTSTSGSSSLNLNQASDLSLFDWSMGTFDSSDLSVPAVAAVFGEFDFVGMLKKQMEDHNSISTIPQTALGAHSCCDRGFNGKPAF
jgi:hypothetical protein